MHEPMLRTLRSKPTPTKNWRCQFFVGAGYRNRTGVLSLGRIRTAIVLIPQPINEQDCVPRPTERHQSFGQVPLNHTRLYLILLS